MSVRLPWEPLENMIALRLRVPLTRGKHGQLLCLTDAEVAAFMGCTATAVARWRREGMSVWTADERCITRLGIRASRVWPEWEELSLIEADEAVRKQEAKGVA